MRGDGTQVFCHMTVGNEGGNVACVSLFHRTVRVSAFHVFVYFPVKRTIVQRRGDWLYLSLFSNAGGRRERNKERENTKQIFEEFERRGRVDGGSITNMGVLEVRECREEHSCKMISTVFVIRLRRMCTSLCVFKV